MHAIRINIAGPASAARRQEPRRARAGEVAELVAFLVSDTSSMVAAFRPSNVALRTRREGT